MRMHEGFDLRRMLREEQALSQIALTLGEPARMRILLSLMDGRARTSTELSVFGQVAPSTASAHLHRLLDARLVKIAVEGRHRYYSLGSADVAVVLEQLGVLAGDKIGPFVPTTPAPLRKARSCYDHMAGEIAVALHDRFRTKRWIDAANAPTGDYEITEAGLELLKHIGIDVVAMTKVRRRLAYACLDWSERRPHIAGAVGAAMLTCFLQRRWVDRELDSRSLHLTRLGKNAFAKHFQLEL